MTRSLRHSTDVTDAAIMPAPAPMSFEVRARPQSGDVPAADRENEHDDTACVAPGNTALPATALLALWPLLPTLRMVVERGGVRAAAAALGVQAPAVSKAIRQLENAIGEDLFVRVGRTMVPTERARTIHRDVRAAMRLIDSALHAGRPLRLVVSAPLMHRVLTAARGLPVGYVQQLGDLGAAMSALKNGTVDAIVGCGDVVCGPEIELDACGVIVEVEVGGDAGIYDGEDAAAAAVAVRSGFRTWMAADLAPIDIEVRRRRQRPWWLAIRCHTGSPELLSLRTHLKEAVPG